MHLYFYTNLKLNIENKEAKFRSIIDRYKLHFGTIKSVNTRHQINDVEYLHLFFYNKRVIDPVWVFRGYNIRHKTISHLLL